MAFAEVKTLSDDIKQSAETIIVKPHTWLRAALPAAFGAIGLGGTGILAVAAADAIEIGSVAAIGAAAPVIVIGVAATTVAALAGYGAWKLGRNLTKTL